MRNSGFPQNEGHSFIYFKCDNVFYRVRKGDPFLRLFTGESANLVRKVKFCATRQPVFPGQSSNKMSCNRIMELFLRTNDPWERLSALKFLLRCFPIPNYRSWQSTSETEWQEARRREAVIPPLTSFPRYLR
jgi:hypothetical protein